MKLSEMPEVKATHALLKKQAEESGDSLILDLFVQKIEELGDDVQPELDDLEDGETRGLLYGRSDGDDYFDVPIKPPTEIFRFLEEADAGALKKPEFEKIERQIVDWCMKRYCPPAHLGFYVDFSEALVATCQPAKLELWFTRRKWCAAY